MTERQEQILLQNRRKALRRVVAIVDQETHARECNFDRVLRLIDDYLKSFKELDENPDTARYARFRAKNPRALKHPCGFASLASRIFVG